MSLRLFAAIAMPDDIIERLLALQKGVPGAKWRPRENLHLTLRFLGSIDEDLVDGIAVRLKKVAARHPPFEAKARGLGEFGGHVLWVGIDGGEPLVKMQKDVEATIVELGFAREERLFHPHITVGRVKEFRAQMPVVDEAEQAIGVVRLQHGRQQRHGEGFQSILVVQHA